MTKVALIAAGALVALVYLVAMVKAWRLIRKVRQLCLWYRMIVREHAQRERGGSAGAEIRKLLEHVKHHADEGIEEGVDVRWLASMENLTEIIRRYKALPRPPIDLNLEWLFVHWMADPKHMTPPPAGYLLSRARDVVEVTSSAEASGRGKMRDPERYVGSSS